MVTIVSVSPSNAFSAPSFATGLHPTLYVVGDVHVAHDAPEFLAFLDHLSRQPVARLVILGDLFEYWLETDAMVRHYAPVLTRLRHLRALGWRLDLVLGNREFAAGRRLVANSGCTLHWPHLDLTLGQRRLRIVHGDRLCYDPGYRAFAAFMRAFFWRAWYPAFPGWIQDWVAQHLRERSKNKQRRHYQRPPGSRPQVFIDRRKVQGSARTCDTLIAGHIHQSWQRVIGGVELFLVGDWPTGDGHWIEGFAHGELQRRRLQGG